MLKFENHSSEHCPFHMVPLRLPPHPTRGPLGGEEAQDECEASCHREDPGGGVSSL